MNSRWSDADAQGKNDLDLLVYASRLIGAETTLVVWGGGNTSVKRDERDHRNRPTRVLRVKGSGSDLKSIQTKDFPGVRMDDVLALLERQDMGDQEMVDYLAHALQEPASPRPSIETLLHGFLPATAVIHTHADAVVSLTNNDRSRDVLREVYGDEVIPLPYRRPGFLISREVAQTFEAHPKARALLLEKHGTICWGATVKEAYLATIELISRAEEAIAHRARGRARFGGVALASPPAEERRRVALAVAPAPARAGRARPAPGPVLRRCAGRARVRGLARGGGALPHRARHAGPHDLHQAAAVLRARREPGGSGVGARRRHRGGGALRGRLHRLLRGPQHGGRPSSRTRSRASSWWAGSASSPPARTGAPRAS